VALITSPTCGERISVQRHRDAIEILRFVDAAHAGRGRRRDDARDVAVFDHLPPM
jgi:hypothetical protein